MDRSNDINTIIQDSSWKERFSNPKKETEQQAARLSEKMDRTFNNFMKLFEEVAFEHKYLEKREAQGSSKRTRNWIECPKDIKIEL